MSDAKSISLNIVNENKELPFPAQSRLENEQHQKITSPLVVLPPLQRVEPSERSVVRITKTPEADRLPQDRESVFYFNLREIPPKSTKTNVMQLALQTQIKLFYRPKAIVAPRGRCGRKSWCSVKRRRRHRRQPDAVLHHPDRHDAADAKQGGGAIGGFQPLMLKPKSSESLKLHDTGMNSFVITYINDYGGHPELRFACNGNVCTAVPEKNKEVQHG